jgi:hypothetical protein
MLNIATTLGESARVCTPQSGIEKATVPRVARTIGKVQQRVFAWTNPLKPARFAASYIAFMLVIFHQHLFAAANYGFEESFSLDFGLIGALIAAPVGMYFLARSVSKNRKGIARKLGRMQKKMKRLLQRAEEKASNKEGKLKWWAWVLIIIGGFFALIILILLIAIIAAIINCGGSGGGCNCGGGGGGGCDCGCGDCSGCDCGGCSC